MSTLKQQRLEQFEKSWTLERLRELRLELESFKLLLSIQSGWTNPEGNRKVIEAVIDLTMGGVIRE